MPKSVCDIYHISWQWLSAIKYKSLFFVCLCLNSKVHCYKNYSKFQMVNCHHYHNLFMCSSRMKLEGGLGLVCLVVIVPTLMLHTI